MIPRRPKVLVVDDEDDIVMALHRVLYQDNHRYDVLLARSAEIAQEILEENRVDVLVTDVHLPEKSGMDLLSWVAVQAPSTRVIVMTAFDVSGIKDRAHAFGCLRLMCKPLDVQEMRAAILRALTLRDSITGSLTELSCVDVIQMLCIARKSVALRLAEGHSAGVIHIEGGEPVHAVWDELAGEEAFFRILGVKNGLFYTTPLPPEVERSLHGDWQYLLIEGMRRLDEANAGRDALPEGDRSSMRISFGSIPPPPGPSAPAPEPAKLRVPEPASGATVTLSRSTVGSMLRGPSPDEDRVSSPPPSSEAMRFIDEGWDALRAGDRDEARRAWEEALRLDPDNRLVEVNLRKLGSGAPLSASARARQVG
jgi:DNA-binding NarL/FixJ family response regulator